LQNFLSLVYLSRATVPLDDVLTRDLLAGARAHNGAHEITGMLCTGRGCFVQVLEGPEREVITLYARIIRDARHEDVQLLTIRLATERAFARWSMGHVDGAHINTEIHAKVLGAAIVTQDPTQTARTLRTALDKLRLS
jgi:RNA-binding protein YlmH